MPPGLASSRCEAGWPACTHRQPARGWTSWAFKTVLLLAIWHELAWGSMFPGRKKRHAPPCSLRLCQAPKPSPCLKKIWQGVKIDFSPSLSGQYWWAFIFLSSTSRVIITMTLTWIVKFVILESRNLSPSAQWPYARSGWSWSVSEPELLWMPGCSRWKQSCLRWCSSSHPLSGRFYRPRWCSCHQRELGIQTYHYKLLNYVKEHKWFLEVLTVFCGF